ncbi:MAG: hypothetical protein E7645_05190 [Ruminococcaceae bacterium]|nr:hypothetical protein [Oscillospiraceae bacterium]
MKGITVFETLTDIREDYIRDAELDACFLTAPVRKRERGPSVFSRFMNSGWGVAIICALVAVSVMGGIIWAGFHAGDVPPAGVTSDGEFVSEIETEPPVPTKKIWVLTYKKVGGTVFIYEYDEYGRNVWASEDGKFLKRVYDENFRLVEENRNDEHTVVYTYDEAGWLISKVTDVDINAIYYTNNENGQILKEERCSEGEVYQVTSYTYDDQGRVQTQRLESPQANAIKSLKVYSYGENGSYSYRVYEGGITYTTKYQCDKQGTCVSIITTDEYGEELSSSYYEYDNQGREIRFVHSSEGVYLEDNSTYEGELLSKVHRYQRYDEQFSPQENERNIYYKYDEHGNLLSIEQYSRDGLLVSSVVYRYEEISVIIDERVTDAGKTMEWVYSKG